MLMPVCGRGEILEPRCRLSPERDDALAGLVGVFAALELRLRSDAGALVLAAAQAGGVCGLTELLKNAQ